MRKDRLVAKVEGFRMQLENKGAVVLAWNGCREFRLGYYERPVAEAIIKAIGAVLNGSDEVTLIVLDWEDVERFALDKVEKSDVTS